MTSLKTYQLRLAKDNQQGWLQLIRVLFSLAEKIEFQPHTAYYSSGEQLQWTPTEALQLDLEEQKILSSPFTNVRRIFFVFRPTPQVLEFIETQVLPATSNEWGYPPVPKFYRGMSTLMEWDWVDFWLKLTEAESQTLKNQGIPIVGPYTQRRRYSVELQDAEQDWSRLLDFVLPKTDRVTFQANPVTVRAQDTQGTWQEKVWQWSPSGDLQAEAMNSTSTDEVQDIDTSVWLFPLTPPVKAFLRSNEELQDWHIANNLPENPCLYAGTEKILETISHEDLILIRLFEAEIQALRNLDFAEFSPYPEMDQLE